MLYVEVTLQTDKDVNKRYRRHKDNMLIKKFIMSESGAVNVSVEVLIGRDPVKGRIKKCQETYIASGLGGIWNNEGLQLSANTINDTYQVGRRQHIG